MTYMELKDMREKYKNNIVKTIAGSWIFYFIAILIFGFAGTSLLAAKVLLVITIIIIINMVLLILCALRINFHLADEMKKTWMEETGMPY